MAKVRGNRVAFGRPGIEPRWTQGNKDGVGTAYSGGSRIWFTLFGGVVTEVYYPTVDRPQSRDLQYLVSDGESLFHEEKRHLSSHTERLSSHSLGYRITNSDPEGRYAIEKEVIADPHLPCLLQRTRMIGDEKTVKGLRLYALCAPHLEVGGSHNNACVMEVGGRSILAARKGPIWLAVAATVPFSRLSCGYVGQSDGWTDLTGNLQMDWEFDQAPDGNVALTGELNLQDGNEFTLGLAFGDTFHSAATTLFQSLAIPFNENRSRFNEQWSRSSKNALALEKVSGDGGKLCQASSSLLRRAAAYLVRYGPATQQERWEEASGYSPSTLASNIAALICAAHFCRERGDEATATFLGEYADFLECHLESWLVTTDGTLVPGLGRHYIRILPVDVSDPFPAEDPNKGVLALANRPPGAEWQFPAKEIVDAGFLELVRYGIRKPDDPVIVNSLKVIDAVLKVETPFGPCWRRYNHDGYGQREDGSAYQGWGKGRAWPLLTGERGHFELAAGRDVKPFIRAIERFASPAGLLPEQVWDGADLPQSHMHLGCPTGAAMPLMWAHAEYMKLLRSTADGQVFDFIPEVADRYRSSKSCRQLEIWKPNRHVRSAKAGMTLRVQAPAAFRLHWSGDDWRTVHDTTSSLTALQIEFVDIPVPISQRAPIRFTFLWTADERWEGRDYEVAVAR